MEMIMVFLEVDGESPIEYAMNCLICLDLVF